MPHNCRDRARYRAGDSKVGKKRGSEKNFFVKAKSQKTTENQEFFAVLQTKLQATTTCILDRDEILDSDFDCNARVGR